MSRKKRISIVAGDLRLPRMLGLFEGLAEKYDPTVFLLNNAATINNHATGLKVLVFENISEMPGYMRDLEDQLDGSDFIISFETSKLATFQAVRIARKHSIPCGIVVNEYQPFFYDGYQNIRAVQYDVMQKADVFWATTAQAANTLLVDGVAGDRISRVNIPVDFNKFKYHPSARAKFRKYVGIKDNEIVILVKAALETWTNVVSLLEGLSIVKKRGAFGARNIKILIAGDGAQAKDLKYKSADLGIGNHTMFLHQDCEPFYSDLLCASDLVFDPKLIKGDYLPDIATHIVEAMACNVVPIVVSGTVGAELAGDSGFVCNDGSPESIAAVIQSVLMDPISFEKKRLQVQKRCAKNFDLSIQSDKIVQSIDAIFSSHVGRSDALPKLLEQARAFIRSGKERDAMVALEEGSILGLTTVSEKVEWHLLRGEAYYGLGDMDAATIEFSDCLRLDDKNIDCLRGLGFVSWKGHSNEEAMVFFRKVLALRQDDRRSQYGIGLIFRRLGLLEDSLFWLEQSMIGPERPDSAIVAYSQTCIQMNRPEKAAKRVEQVLETIGDHPTLMMTLGQLYMTLGRIPEAQEMMNKATLLAG